MTSPHDHPDLPPPTVEEVTDDVFAYLQPDGSWGLNNTGFIAASDAVIAIDACFTERRTRSLLDAIRAVSTQPVRALVNTHHHPDHTHGNYLFLPGATIIGHDLCRKEVIETGLSIKPLFPGVDWGDLEIAPPTVTFAERLDLYAGDLRIELIYVGPAHTTNDIIAWLPDRKTLFAGDVIFNQGTPFALMGSVAGWLDALDRLRALGAKRIVPGHGPVCGTEVIDDVAAYLLFVQDAARKGHKAGLSPLETARETDLDPFAGWLDPERLAGNLHRAYAELRGEPRGASLPLMAAMGDMIAYNGGQPLRCLA